MKKKCKKITAAVMAATTLAVSMVGMSANAVRIDKEYGGKKETLNIFEFKKNIPLTYSRINASTGWTGITTTDYGNTTGYRNSYKRATYSEYKDVGGKLVKTYFDSNDGTAEIIKTDYTHHVSATTVKRLHTAKLHVGSNPGSSVMEEFFVTVLKTGYEG